MTANNLKQNDWKVQPDTTVQVVDPHGMKTMDPPTLDKPRNWRGICVSLGIIGGVFVFISIAAVILYPLELPPFAGRRICLNDLNDPRLVASPMGAQWISDQEIVFVSEENGILLLDVSSNVSYNLMNSVTWNHTKTTEFYLSPNRRYILLVHDVHKERLFRQSALYSIYDISNGHYRPLKLSSASSFHPRYQHVQWLKDIRKVRSNETTSSTETRTGEDGEGVDLLIVENNNINLIRFPNGSSFQITDNGNNDVFNGVPDLVYEEILRKSSSIWPNPSGKYLLYASFDASAVKELPILNYGADSLPKIIPLRYSTVNTPIPKVTIWVQDMTNLDPSNKRKSEIIPPPGMPREHYFLGADWVNERKIWVSWVSRDQSTTMLATCEADRWECSLLHPPHKKQGISPIVQNVVWSDKWAAFPWPDTNRQGSGHNHIAEVNVHEERRASRVIKGYHVIKILASAVDFSTSDHLIYFLGSSLNMNITGDQQLYESSDKGRVSCISCHLGCFRVTASINGALRYALVRCLGTLRPSVHIVDIQMENSFPIHKQHFLREALKDLALPKIITKDISLSPELHASVTLSLPPSWKPEDETFRFPLVVQCIGIEDFDSRDAVTRLGWPELLTSGHEVAHAKIEILESISMQPISTRKTAKYVDSALRSLLDEYEFLDRNQVFGLGRNSGASVAIQLAAMNPSAFGCVVAINPVYNWRQYASFWAERMLGPLDAQDGGRCYEESHLFRALGGLNRTRVMLVQSLGDPLSHHATHVARSLIENKAQFKHVVYPDSSISLRETRIHLLESIQKFLLNPAECIKVFYHQTEEDTPC